MNRLLRLLFLVFTLNIFKCQDVVLNGIYNFKWIIYLATQPSNVSQTGG